MKLSVLTLGALALIAVPSVQATPTITLTAYNSSNAMIGSSTVLTDNGGGDLDLTLGVITALNVNLGGYKINVSSGVTKPEVGTALRPEMDITLSGTISAAGGFVSGNYLVVTFYENLFSPIAPPTTDIATFSATSFNFGSVTYETWLNQTQGGSAPTGGSLLTTQTLTQPSTGYQVGPNGALNTSPYSLTQKLTLAASGAGGNPISIDAHLTTVPDGGFTLSLLGFSLAGLGMIRRKALA